MSKCGVFPSPGFFIRLSFIVNRTSVKKRHLVRAPRYLRNFESHKNYNIVFFLSSLFSPALCLFIIM